jgi:hypothetical protein
LGRHLSVLLLIDPSRTHMKPSLDESKLLYVSNRKEWRAWLRKHHKSETEVWLVYFKAHSGKPVSPTTMLSKKRCALAGLIVQSSVLMKIDLPKGFRCGTPRLPIHRLTRNAYENL